MSVDGSDEERGQEPPRGPLPPEVEAAARVIHWHVWGEPYRPGQGSMHYAGGPYWHDALLRKADEWERMAAAARICAEHLPAAPSPLAEAASA